MSDTSGEMHTVTPRQRMAGSWYTRLLPTAQNLVSMAVQPLLPLFLFAAVDMLGMPCVKSCSALAKTPQQ
jgi:hypothetical protein